MQAADFVVRDALESDRAAILSIMQAAWKSAYTPIYSPDLMNRIFSERLPQHAAWTAERSEKLDSLVAEQAGGGLAGMAGLALCKDGEGELTHLYVKPSSQGKGV